MLDCLNDYLATPTPMAEYRLEKDEMGIAGTESIAFATALAWLEKVQ